MNVRPTIQEQLTLRRYLERYAETIVQDINVECFNEFETVIVVPVYDESDADLEHFLEHQRQSQKQQSTLLIWVFNAPESSVGSTRQIRTQQVFTNLLLKTRAKKLSETLYLSKVQDTLQVLCVDRCHELLILDKQGVGLARKLGMDLALSLIYQQYLKNNTWCYWIYSTDADVELPLNYGVIPPKVNTVACLYPFQHVPETGFERAMSEYEFSLHYYVESLKHAGSPYAFHTIGSLIVVSSIAYAQVRGMPKRAGAEDFYLLNKLAKLGDIESLNAPSIQISGRPSHRVPFGTGPALVKITSQYEDGQSFDVYHPRNFLLLALVLESVSEIEHSNAEEDILLSRLASKLSDQQERDITSEILIGLGWKKQAIHLARLKTSEAIQKAFHVWFDGFITLRFIHECRDRLHPNISLADLPDELTRVMGNEFIRGNEFDYITWFKTLGI